MVHHIPPAAGVFTFPIWVGPLRHLHHFVTSGDSSSSASLLVLHLVRLPSLSSWSLANVRRHHQVGCFWAALNLLRRIKRSHWLCSRFGFPRHHHREVDYEIFGIHSGKYSDSQRLPEFVCPLTVSLTFFRLALLSICWRPWPSKISLLNTCIAFGIDFTHGDSEVVGVRDVLHEIVGGWISVL